MIVSSVAYVDLFEDSGQIRTLFSRSRCVMWVIEGDHKLQAGQEFLPGLGVGLVYPGGVFAPKLRDLSDGEVKREAQAQELRVALLLSACFGGFLGVKVSCALEDVASPSLVEQATQTRLIRGQLVGSEALRTRGILSGKAAAFDSCGYVAHDPKQEGAEALTLPGPGSLQHSAWF